MESKELQVSLDEYEITKDKLAARVATIDENIEEFENACIALAKMLESVIQKNGHYKERG